MTSSIYVTKKGAQENQESRLESSKIAQWNEHEDQQQSKRSQRELDNNTMWQHQIMDKSG